MSKGRLAGKAVNLVRDILTPKGMNAGQLATRLGPDALFAVLAGINAGPEATVADQLLLGGASFAGGAGGGIVAGNLAGKVTKNQTIQGLADMAGSIGGDMASMNVGLGATALADRLSGGAGLNPYERMSAQQHAEMERVIAERLMQGYGVLPGTLQDNFLAQTGLG